ncbi:filamentous hemagglutinin N-terminal domain-containing protein [Pseudomonas sp. ANT_H14]|uniref:filamentous hemagglutinin family protein n=1 Tax=unclassified Pseudomonas TaxID=196821 RepID=UPI0011EFC277|nr:MULTISPECIES: filamentous hemagglutinin family protein [unclassified Pseudomonas]KAA0942635.1 filamentous hemagglutinin N-terminal domain-containing protein [Pseudomonas sp. ANT_H4]KAA0948382.1 filamentous hemagglutinin N-terminal domain-containing protein [Pseudomonas sp. ANT_H14]
MVRCKPPVNVNAQGPGNGQTILRLKPLAHAIALLLVAGSAHGATAFSSGWFADKGASQAATAARPGAQVPGMPPPLSQQARVNQQLQRSLSTLNTSVAAIAAQQAAQAAGRQAALGHISTIPDGLGKGGLQVDNSLTQGWTNAKGPTQSQAGGKTTVTIEQTADKAILNWETFNVGRNTTVDFQQQSNWALLNRVNDPNARPSEIQGQIKGAGTVMIMNRNGVVFSGSSQVNVRNLVAAAATITDDQFTLRGIYVDANGTQPTFTDAAGKVEVQRGALIQTHAPATSTDSGGYALLLGSEVENAGTIITAKGQTTLAAGDSFYIRRGVGTAGNDRSTTRGNEVATSLKAGSTSGKVSNSGLIMASTGDITLTGHQVEQNGVVLASTSVDTRGTIHLLNSASDSTGSVTLGQGSTSAILLDSSGSTALNSQKDNGLIKLDGHAANLITGQFNNLSSVADRTDQSRIEIVSASTVDFQKGSITLATGGQVVVSASQRSLVRDGSMIDVSGAIGVKVSMQSNNIKINVQGNEQRDAPVNRESGKLINNDVWVDLRELVFVPAGTNGYATDRWYTAGGLLEVGGYLGTQGHSVGEWMAQGGTVTFTGKDVVTQQGAQINLSGGTVDVQAGYIQQTWLKGPDGRLYELSKAPGDILYTGFYKGFEDSSTRWGRTDLYYNPLIASQRRYEAGYTVGRDAGKLVVGTTNAVLEGQLISDVFQGDRQTLAPNINLDGYQQSQKAMAQRAQLIIGQYMPIFNKSTGTLRYALTPTTNQVLIEGNSQKIADGLDLSTALPAERQGKLVLDSDQLNGYQLGAIKVGAKQQIEVNGALKVADGGDITLYAPGVKVNANLTAHGGSINAGNVLSQIYLNGNNVVTDVILPGLAGVSVADGVKLDASGRWNNLALDPSITDGVAYINGGNVSLRSTGDVKLAAGSLVSVSSGATIGLDGTVSGGKGGSVTLGAFGALELGGDIRGYGVSGGGTLALQAQKMLVGNNASVPQAGTLQLAGDFFNKGFSAYDITGNEGLIVADGTKVDVSMPVYRLGEQAATTPSGSDPATTLERWTPQLYQEDATKGVLTQRRGASLNLAAGYQDSTAAQMATTALTVGQGAVISVDPGQAINLRSIGQLTVNGTLNAWGGSVSVAGISTTDSEKVDAIGHGRSIWIGEQALIDVAARSVTAVNNRGGLYGQVRNGGQITIGGDINPATGIAKASDLFVVVREGARLDASGTQALLDIPGQGRTLVASNGGSIAFASNNGLYLDGSIVAKAGGKGAAGGRLALALESVYYQRAYANDRVLAPREMILSQVHRANILPDTAESAADSLIYGHGRLGADQVIAGGFDSLALLSRTLSFAGDVSLNMGQSLELYSGGMGLALGASNTSQVSLNAPHVVLSGILSPLRNENFLISPSSAQKPAIPGQGLFTLDSDLLDIRGEVFFALNSGFDQVHLNSRGDLRFLAGRDGAVTEGFSTILESAGDLTLRAARIYPGSGISAQVLVGSLGGNNQKKEFDPTRTLTIEKVGSDTGVAPYSVFGRLQLGAATIKQGGVLRAPLGVIELGNLGSTRVELLPGSLTSVSGRGLVLPYGGTVDGQTYRYNGKTVNFVGQGGVVIGSGDLTVGVILGGKSVVVLPEAVLDLSGGGELLGAGFISGRGGSTDARYNPLVQFGANGGFALPGLNTNPVYAIVPGAQPGYAPVAAEGGAVAPLVGQQITIGAGVSGLPAGTYTLMPSTYALMPGAFRVEINGLAGLGSDAGATPMRNGSWSTVGRLSIINTGIQNDLVSQVILTSADTLRRYSQYNETGYTQFAIADAAKLGVPRPLLPMDAKTLKLAMNVGGGSDTFSFKGIGRFDAAPGGFGGTVALINRSLGDMQIVDASKPFDPGFTGLTVDAQSLNALGAKRLLVGGLSMVLYGQGGNTIEFARGENAPGGSILLRAGVTLAAPEVILVAGSGDIVIEQGASINTIGQGAASYDARDGFVYKGVPNMLAVSNGLLNVLPYVNAGDIKTGGIQIGVCATGSCSGQTSLYSQGSIVAATDTALELGDQVRYGTRHLALALSNINVGSTAGLADAAARNVLPAGLTLNQQVLDRLLRGDTQFGAPTLETLQLSASKAFNFYGTTTLDTYDPQTGKSRLDNFLLSTPAIYGSGDANDVATIHTAHLIWQGSEGAPGAVIAGGAGIGRGRLDINAERIEFGYGAFSQKSTTKTFDRLALGFANINLNASERITANHKGSLSVYQRQSGYDPVKGFQYIGGNLNILTPLMTGEAGSANRITAGGAIDVAASAGVRGTVNGLGAELSLQGDSIRLATAVVLPSGKVSLGARGDVILTGDALIDVAGRAIAFNDVTQYSWGGDVLLDSRTNNILQAVGSTIDLSATHNRAGKLRAMAVDAAGGIVDLQGKILGGSSGYYDAGGTLMPYQAGTVEIQAQRLGSSANLDQQFADLNQRLNGGQVFGSRSFQLKQGDLTIGNGLKAGTINVSVDNGSLLVTGRVDASGERVGSINLAGKHGLTLDGSAVLDAHGSKLRVDSYGKIIDSPNRAMVILGSGTGLLTLADGVRIDLRHGTDVVKGNDGRNRGTLELNAPRLINLDGTSNDIAIDAHGQLNIQGARSITLNGMISYDDAEVKTDSTASGRPYQVIDQNYLEKKHDLSVKFIDAALLNNNLRQNKLAGLNNATYADAFHLRPGVEIVSKTPDGDLVVQGDLDLSGFRYASLNPHIKKTDDVYGSGESGSLTLRASGDLNIYGSINDGFAPPPETVDDKGWVLLPGIDFTGGDIVVPGHGVTLADGTAFPAGTVLNYDLPIKGMTMAAGTRLPVRATLTQDLVLPSGTVLAASVLDASGNVLLAAGTLLSQAHTLVAGSQLEAGSLLAQGTKFGAMTWPKGVPLPSVDAATRATDNIVTLNGNIPLPRGALIPSGTNIKLLAGADSVQLRAQVAGKPNRLWAISPMLAEGSQSWSLRLVAGADTEAADSRILQAHPRSGDLHLADSHYGMFAKQLPPEGVQTWTAQAILDLGPDGEGLDIKEGEPIDQKLFDDLSLGTVADFCLSSAEYCAIKAQYVWTQVAVDDLGVEEGTVITDAIVKEFNNPTMHSVEDLCAQLPSYCLSLSVTKYAAVPSSTRFSVIRTGTGDLELLSASNLSMDSLYGVYTAGTSSTSTYKGDPYNQPKALGRGKTVLNDPGSYFEQFVNGDTGSLYRAWYPEAGGNLTMNVGGNLTGNIVAPLNSGFFRPNPLDAGTDSASVGNWLWRQGSADVNVGGQPQPTAWWINFGSYTADNDLASKAASADQLVGFTGFGTLGGGDLDIQVAGDAGLLQRMAGNAMRSSANPRSQGLVLAVGSTGRVASDGSLQLTGGGDLRVRIGGAVNPASDLLVGGQNGMLVNLRGNAQLLGGALGQIDLHYGSVKEDHGAGETRAFDALQATRGRAVGGMTLVPGDATFSLATLGDVVLQDVVDPGRVELLNSSPFTRGSKEQGNLEHGIGTSWFSLWTERTAIDLFSAGGNLTPNTGGIASDLAIVYPSIVRATAASGSFYYGKAAASPQFDLDYSSALLLAPGAHGQLQFLANDSIYAGGMFVTPSSADPSVMATPSRPAFVGRVNSEVAVDGSNLSANGSPANGNPLPLFVFGSASASTTSNRSTDPARFYAVTGDLVGVTSGRIISFDSGPTYLHTGQTWYEGGAPVWMMAGRDIVSSGSRFNTIPSPENALSTGNLFIHNSPNDISIVSAGRDILYSNFQVAGPGTLELTAGRNILMSGGDVLKGGEVSVTSLGPVAPGDNRPGASIVMQAGAGPNGPDYRRFVEAYLNPANLAQPGEALSIQGRKVAKTYENELVTWLAERFGFEGDSEQARAYYTALSAEQQRVFAREVYFTELKAAGREYNQDGGARQGSYVRGRAAIAALFPDKDVAGNTITYKGDITLFGGSGVHTNFGGSIQMLTPGGGQTFGIEGAAPPASAGVITQGAGDIQLYSMGSILLGQSRIMTTFGGSIMGWSAAGDINAGRGSKTTVVYTPPKRVYDGWGNVTLSPSVPSTGAGIATLNPIPEVPAGDIDLIAPLGTVDAGEAGIRVSGNINIAALRVVNAANIQTQGKSSGVPVSAAVNTGAMSSASAAGAAASQAAEDAARNQQAAARGDRASIVTVEVLGFGTEPVPRGQEDARRAPVYNPDSPVQVLGAGPLSEQARARLTDEERGQISL